MAGGNGSPPLFLWADGGLSLLKIFFSIFLIFLWKVNNINLCA